MKLSIIVPVYNMVADGKLAFCMDSLLAQTITDYEIIAVDDKSTDDSLVVLKEYEAKHPDKVKVIASPENRRQGGAKNLGLRHASGEWIGFVDSDDWISPDFYETLFAKAEETGADIVGCHYCIKNTHDYEIGPEVQADYDWTSGPMDEEKYAAAVLYPGSMVVNMYKREIFYDNGLWFPEYMFYEDNCTGILTMLCCKHYEYVKKPMYYYYQHDASTVHHISEAKCTNRMQVMEILIGECYKRGFLEEYPDEIEYRFTEMFYINTLFTYMIGMPFHKKKISYLRLLRDGILAYFPEYASNPYFEEKQDAEVKKLTAMHCKSPFRFFWYYTALTTYRKVRKKLRGY